jgi:hypothetical protein
MSAEVFLPLSRGKVTVIDFFDLELVRGFRWFAKQKTPGGLWYAVRNSGGRKAHRQVYLHRLVAEADPGDIIDHRNRDTLDNRATKAQNGTNCARRKSSPHPFKGAYLIRGKWRAQIKVGDRTEYLGTFSEPEVAARAYDAAALKYFGEFACLNFPISKPQPKIQKP